MAERRAAQNAALVRDKLLEALMAKIESSPDADSILELLDADTRQIIAEASDRAYGKPMQSQDVTSNGESVAMPASIVIRGVDAEEG